MLLTSTKVYSAPVNRNIQFSHSSQNIPPSVKLVLAAYIYVCYSFKIIFSSEGLQRLLHHKGHTVSDGYVASYEGNKTAKSVVPYASNFKRRFTGTRFQEI